MIDAKEFRIGNRVTHKNKEGFFKILSIDGFNSRVILNGVTQHAYQPVRFINPIPLTIEIILQCGFEPNNTYTQLYPHFEIRSTRSNELVEYVFRISVSDDEWRWIEGNVNVPFYYLHQLQNLYYALTQKELEWIKS